MAWVNILDATAVAWTINRDSACTDDGVYFSYTKTLADADDPGVLAILGPDTIGIYPIHFRVTVLEFTDPRVGVMFDPPGFDFMNGGVEYCVDSGPPFTEWTGTPFERDLSYVAEASDTFMCRMGSMEPGYDPAELHIKFLVEVFEDVELPYDYLGQAEDQVRLSKAIHLGLDLAIGAQGNAVFNEAFNLLRTYLLRDRLAAGATASKQGMAVTKLAQDRAVFEDDAMAVVILLLVEGVVFSDAPQATYTQIAAVIAKLVLTGQAQNFAQALVMVLDAMVASDLASAMQRGDLADTIALNAAVEPRYRLIAQLLDRMLTMDLAKGHFTLSALIQDRFVAGADLTQTAQVVQILRDSIGFSFTLAIEGGEYIAWVMNTTSKGVSRYSNYPFNSFMKVGDTQFAVASNGVHRLGGDDDNGVNIDAQIRLGLSALGTRKLKRVPECFIGMSSRDGGTLLIKVITVDELTGDKKAYVYEMVHRPALVTRENRRKFGQGLQSVDWDFEIANVDGKHFDLASVQFRPVILDRRTRG